MRARAALAALIVAFFCLSWGHQKVISSEAKAGETKSVDVPFSKNIRKRSISGEMYLYPTTLKSFGKVVCYFELKTEIKTCLSPDGAIGAPANYRRLPNENPIFFYGDQTVYLEVQSRRLPGIFKLTNERFFIPNSFYGEGIRINVSPQLALGCVLCDFDGILGRLSGLLGGINEFLGVRAGGLHFAELAVYNQVGNKGSYEQSGGEVANAAAPARHRPLVLLVEGVFLLLLGVVCAIAMQEGASYAEDRGFPWWVPFLAFAGLTCFFVFHGFNRLDSYFDQRESRAAYLTTFNGATEAFRSTGDKV